ncbi:helix-turn-helix domain-containing protein [Nocardia cyriacigeorgica]|uniref:Putative DNA-binding protein n=1 Tax=Nocardia cyriacigeorgica (strain GUH-2) TaxID=1127134 RepID=H6R202_NOCCG|nr:helix-turn-helix transcriptional regulator [Nocardia cyriacigeorgica]BDT86721.1 transcriptional regulator [Nocardia cyriacigeorgica]CCF63081.1 putative DNA-binding protein [Nocardia cyriacigeorgica GUH-2]
MTAPPDDARRALGERLRELRRDAGLSGVALARAAGWQGSKVSKIEYGRQTPTEADIQEWCRWCRAEYAVPDLVATLRNLTAAYVEWRRIVVSGHAHRQRQAITLESGTRCIRGYHPRVVPGLVQTREYASAIFQSVAEFYGSPNDLEAAVATRMQRQHVLHRGDHRIHYLIEEQALYTTIGEDAVMAGQLRRLLDVMRLPRLAVGIIPRTAEYRAPATNFVIHDRKTVLVETVAAELTITRPSEIALYEKSFALLAAQSVHGESARELINAALHLRDSGT